MDDYNESLGEEHWGVFAFQILAIPPKEYLKKGVPPTLIASGEVIARDDEEARVLALLELAKDQPKQPESGAKPETEAKPVEGTDGTLDQQPNVEQDREQRLAKRLLANEVYAILEVPMLDSGAATRIKGFFKNPRARIQVHVARKG